MFVSVLVIAHDEEKHIEKCLHSLQNQTQSPDEIVVVVHNSTDRTAHIARSFSGVRVIEHHTEEKGPLYARIKGFQVVKGDVIACIDGDSCASPRWLEKIIEPILQNKNIVGAGGFILFNGLFANLASFSFFFLDPIFRPTYHFYFWGANFSVRKSAYDAVGGLEPLILLKEKLQLKLMPDDAYLSCALLKQGKVMYVSGARVYSDSSFFTEESFVQRRGSLQNDDRLSLFKYFNLIS